MRPKARILDMDGTLADVSSIRHYVLRPRELKDFDAFHAASEFVPPHQQAIDYAIETHEMGMVPVIVTARMEKWRGATVRWLERNMPVPYDGPFHRADGDRRSDRVVKLEIFRYLMRNYDIRGAIDDNPEVVALHRQMGWPVEIVPGWEDEPAKAYADLANRVD